MFSYQKQQEAKYLEITLKSVYTKQDKTIRMNPPPTQKNRDKATDQQYVFIKVQKR